jgi:formylglycine-generating enzyme required for sulfatase activity
MEIDGIFLDTMDRGASSFREKLDAVRSGVVLEGEIALPVERVFDHHLSWAQWFQDLRVPGVLRNKWFERRHLQHQIRRWDTDHTAELHTAWMNGSGMMVWENVFGSWMGWSPRDRSLLRTILPIQRRYGALFCGERWTPLVPTLHPDVFASLWEGEGLRLWTLVNRSERWLRAVEVLEVETRSGTRYDDLVAGASASLQRRGAEKAVFRVDLAPRGVACLLAAEETACGADHAAFLAEQAALGHHASHAVQPETRRTVLQAPVSTPLRRRVPAGMAAIPGGELVLKKVMRVRECGFYESVPAPGHRLGGSYDYQLETFEVRVTLGRYAMDLTPVTNAQFAEFLRRSGYVPRHRENFLRHWGHGHPALGEEEHPVVNVDLEDARAYARWAGKRLPTEEEWQHAAQGADGRKYPWGELWEPGRCNDGSGGTGTTPVRAFPGGRSPFGIYDLCGNVWEWTDSERSDGRTRFCLLKGGSYYRARGSGWYFDGGPQTNAYAAKFLLMCSGLDRCATVGFRCVVDLKS